MCLEASSARKQEQVVASCAQPLYCEHTEDWRKLRTGRTCRIGGRLWGTGDTKTSCGKEGSQLKGLESEVEGLRVVDWDAVEMAGLVVKSMAVFSFTHALQECRMWIKEGGRLAEGFP